MGKVYLFPTLLKDAELCMPFDPWLLAESEVEQSFFICGKQP